jgi:hypothetical protein
VIAAAWKEKFLHQEIQMTQYRKFITGVLVALAVFALSSCEFLGGALTGGAVGGVGGYELGKSQGTAQEKVNQDQAEIQQQRQEINSQQQEIDQLKNQENE